MLKGVGVVAATFLLLNPAAADVQVARDKFLHGDYAGARRDFEATRGGERAAAQLGLAEVLLRTGEHEAALKAVKVPLAQNDLRPQALLVWADINRTIGKLDESITELTAAAKIFPKSDGIRYQLALALLGVGKEKQARGILQTFIDAEQSGQLDMTDAEKLFYTAEAGRLLGQFQYANDTYRDAITRDGNLLDANLAWGRLFLEKYAPGHAMQSFEDVLKIDPQHPDAHVGAARVKLDENYDLAAATKHLEQALAVNPHHGDALVVRASIEIDKNQWEQAQKSLDQALRINPKNLEALSLKATIYWLREQNEPYERTRRTVFQIHPSYAEFFHLVARSAVREHRYADAIELEKQAVAMRPEYYEAMQALGTGYLRLGEEKEGLKWLEKAYSGDKYNVRTVNTLELFDDAIAKEYGFTKTKNFHIRAHNNERDALARQVGPLLETAYEEMARRYKYRPKAVTVELYQDPSAYSVRTIGLPNLGALGVCFGPVITAMSPSAGDINWGMVLWHELGHVFAIQLSKSKVPRWYTEGLSEYETVLARPEWRRENDGDIAAAMAEGKLPSVADLNYGFMAPDQNRVVVAYHLSSITIEYIAQTYGFDKLVQGLKLYGQNLETPEVIAKITGRSVTEFDREFRAYLKIRLAPYKGFRLPTDELSDVDKLEKATRAKPDSARAWANLALGSFYSGNAAQAEEAAKKALDLDGGEKIALFVSAEMRFRQKELDDARKLYERLIKAGGDSADIRGRLATIATEQRDPKLAERHLCSAKKLDPESSYPYQALYQLYKEQGKLDRAIAELESFVSIEQMQYTPTKELVDLLAERTNWAHVRAYGEMAQRINPFDPDLLLKLGKAYLETKAPDRALDVYDSALQIKPPLRRPALAYLGKAEAQLILGKKEDARRDLAKALQYEPENREALELQKKL